MAELDFSVEITPPSLPPIKPPKPPTGGISVDTAVSGLMGFIRTEISGLEPYIRTQVEGTIDDLRTQVEAQIPTREEAIDLIVF